MLSRLRSCRIDKAEFSLSFLLHTPYQVKEPENQQKGAIEAERKRRISEAVSALE